MSQKASYQRSFSRCFSMLQVGDAYLFQVISPRLFVQEAFPLLRPSKFEGHRPTIRHGCRMALMVALNW
ncbi:MAG: hypothetical protein BECKG1743E_GA0114224_105064, partial [Candidatus Kentron sp. G]